MPVQSRYVPNNKSMGAFLMSQRVQDVADRAADKVIAIAVSTSPYDAVRERGDDHKHYVDQFRKEPIVSRQGGNPRRASRVLNDSDHAAAVEFGNKANGGRGSHTLRRAGDAVGELRTEAG